MEIPNINHFSTQGASGGPVGIINADLIREVNFYTGAFPADKGNSLSSVLDFKLRDGDMERNSLKTTLGASEVSLASNGHLGKRLPIWFQYGSLTSNSCSICWAYHFCLHLQMHNSN